MTIGEIVREPLDLFEPDMPRLQRDRETAAMLERVGLSTAIVRRYPHEFSGGQCHAHHYRPRLDRWAAATDLR